MMNKVIPIGDYLVRGLFMLLGIALLQKYSADPFIVFTAACIIIFNLLTMFFDRNYQKKHK
jgi:hypothetical protein